MIVSFKFDLYIYIYIYYLYTASSGISTGDMVNYHMPGHESLLSHHPPRECDICFCEI